MNVIDLITFVIVLLLLVFLFFRRALEEKRRREHPEQYEDEQRKLQELLRSLDIDYVEEKQEDIKPAPPPPPPPAKKNAAAAKKLGRHEARERSFIPFKDPHLEKGIKLGQVKEIQKDAFQIPEKERSKAKNIIQKQGSKKDMLILKEILDTPLSMRNLGYSDDRRSAL